MNHKKSGFDAIDGRSLSIFVYNHIKEDILSDRLRPGERLLEIQLSERLGVSRTPIREAFKMLENENFVVIRPRRGVVVAEFDKGDVLQMLEVRQNLEGFASALAAKRITSEELEELKSAAEDFKVASADYNVTEMIDSDTRFHSIIIKAAKNGRLTNIIDALHDQFKRFRLQFFQRKGSYKEVYSEHQKIYDAIASNDSNRARNAAEAHIKTFTKKVDNWTDEY